MIDFHYIRASAEPRYWEDADVDGVQDTDGTLMPCREGDVWIITIDVQSGKVLNWPKGTTADIHYKVCDAGNYELLDSKFQTLYRADEIYVPRLFSPEQSNFGDYVILKIDAEGQISGWIVPDCVPEFFEKV